jgi:diaminohydroxyphosphoribosylaminopyrimidine deaminase/5-amino-6-(5-phosphoribosylamino)uracil reductase
VESTETLYIEMVSRLSSPTVGDTGAMNELTPYMRRALTLAAEGGRMVMPNPMVGAVLVHRNHIIAEGYHEVYGGPHAEVNAIRAVQAPKLLKESTLFVTLEPCAHFGKTPPCADLVIESGIPHVVVGCRDPFPEVAGRGIAKLQDAGIQVTELLRDECILLNRRFILAHRERRPYVILKWAESADGYLASPPPHRGWFTSQESRELVHRWRAEEMAILVGTRTVLIDDPSLTVRYGQGMGIDARLAKNPLRVTVDRAGVLTPDLNIFTSEAETLVFGAVPAGVAESVQSTPIDSSTPLPMQICRELYDRRILSVIVEGGAETLRSFLELGMWDEARVFQAPVEFKAGVKAPPLPTGPHRVTTSGKDTLTTIIHPAVSARLGVDLSASDILDQISPTAS